MLYSDLIKISLDKSKIIFKATQYSRGYANYAETSKEYNTYKLHNATKAKAIHQAHTDTHRLTQIVTNNDTRSIGHRLVTIVY